MGVSEAAVVIHVPVSPSSVVTECCEDVSLNTDWEFVEPQSFSFSKKRSIVWEENRGEMSCEGTPVKAHPNTRRAIEERQWQVEMEVQVFGVLGKGR